MRIWSGYAREARLWLLLSLCIPGLTADGLDHTWCLRLRVRLGASELMVRPSWEEYFMEIAQVVATRSTCLRRQVGAVLVKNRQILATGYNGVPRGIQHCEERGCLRDELGIPSGERQELCRGLHAEQNAIIQAAYHGVAINGAEIYVTLQPCVTCAKMLVNAGVVAVYFFGEYPDALARDLFEEARTRLIRMG